MIPRLFGVFRDPLRTFVVLAVAAGGYLAFAVPWFGGIDEPAHFYRSYHISTGTLVPDTLEGSEFSGACLPTSLLDEITPYQRAYFRHLLELFGESRLTLGGPTGASGADDPTAQVPDALQCADDEAPVTFSTFGSPLPYLPQTAAVLASRAVGLSAGPMLVVGRLVVLAVYVGLVAVAIRRTPRAKWALAAVALMPVAVYQSVGWSHDAITIGIALLVVSSALRALDPPPDVTARSLLVEAVLLSVLLGSCKHVYIVIAGLYLLVLIGRGRRPAQWPIVLAPVAAVITTVVLNEVAGGQWRTDADYFGVQPDVARSREELLTAPWNFAVDAVRTVWHETGPWLDGFWGVGPSVTDWPWVVIAVGVVVYLAVALQRDRSEPPALDGWQRAFVVVVLVAGVALVLAAQYIYWTTPGNDVITGVQARHFQPLVVLVPVAVGTVDVRALRARDATFPVATLLAPFLLAFCITIAFRMH